MSRKNEANLLEEACRDKFLAQWPGSRIVTTQANGTSRIDFVVELAEGGLVILEKKTAKRAAGRVHLDWSPDQIETATLQAILRAIRLDRPIIYSTYSAADIHDPKNKKKLSGFKVSVGRSKVELSWNEIFPDHPLPEAARWKVVDQSVKKQGRYLVITHRLKDGKAKQVHEYKIELAHISSAIFDSTFRFKTFPFNIPHSHKITENGKVSYDRGIDRWEEHAEQKGMLEESKVLSKVCTSCDASFFDTSSHTLCCTCFVAEQKANKKQAKQLIAKAKKLVRSDNWKETGDALKALQQDWKGVNPLPADDAETLWQEFQSTIQTFFDRRSAHFESMDAQRDKNRRKAEKLIAEAKRWSGSEDWKGAADKIKALQQQWKSVHPLPKQCADELWHKFRGFCQSFFDRRSAHYAAKSGR